MKQVLGAVVLSFSILQGVTMVEPIKGKVYSHYSGKKYEIIAIGLDHDLEKVVVYRALYDDPKLGNNVIWVRKLSEWNEPVLIEGVESIRYAPVE